MKSRRRIKCPSCRGRGTFLGLNNTKCSWCLGRKTLGREAALRYSSVINCLAFGKYVDGGTIEELRAEEAAAKAIRAYFEGHPQ